MRLKIGSLVLPAIACVKRHDMATALTLASEAVQRLLTRDLQRIVLACSELPPALEMMLPCSSGAMFADP